MKYIIVTGNPGDGFEYWGSFKSVLDATEHASRDSYFDGQAWWIMPLNPIKGAK